MFDNLLLTRDPTVVVPTIDRPQVLDALSRATLDELRGALTDLRHDQSLRAVVVTGAVLEPLLEAVNGGLATALDWGRYLEASLFGLVATDDIGEGTRAFLEKRMPVFTGS